MKSAIIVTTGYELLNGHIVDTNSSQIARRLLSIGVNVKRMITVGDDPDDIKEIIVALMGRYDFVIITGGLGPTDDDLTKEVAANAFGRKLVIDIPSLISIRMIFERHGLEMTPNNEKQALIPEGAMVIPNPTGTAPGFILEESGTAFIFLPGVPGELERMLDETVIPFIMERRGNAFYYRKKTLNIFGLTEAKIGEMLKGVADGFDGIRIASLPNYPENRIQITSFGKDPSKAESMLEHIEGIIRERIGNSVYGSDEDTLEKVVGDLLRGRGLKISVAESCTGGLLAHRITNCPGSSYYFIEGIVAYSIEAKVDLLGIPSEFISLHGVVSTHVAKAMAEGIRRRSGAAIGIGITGIAGPEGGTPECPVGTVCIAISDPLKTEARSFRFWGGREGIKLLATSVSLDWVRRHILNLPFEFFQ